MGIGIMFGSCCEIGSSKAEDHKVSWVSCREFCRPGPLLPGGDGGKDAGRSGTGEISWGSVSDTKGSVSTVWAVNAWKDC